MERDSGFKAFAQVAIICRDIEATSRRWAALLGVDPPPIHPSGPGLDAQMVYRGKPSNAQCKMAFFNTGACLLELIQPLGPGSSWQEHLDKHGESVHHVAFMVKDLDGSVRTMQELGMPVIHQGRWGSKDGDYVYFESEKQLGVTVELLHKDQRK